jgi:hypothetical protein
MKIIVFYWLYNLYVFHMLSSSIQTLLSASEFSCRNHRINALALAGFTAGRDLHPALKIFLMQYSIHHVQMVYNCFL